MATRAPAACGGAEDRLGDEHRLPHLGDVVDPQHVGAGPQREHVEAIVPPSRSPTSRPVERADEALARRPDDDRPAELPQLAEPAQELEVVLDGLAEPDPRIDPDPLLGDPRADGDLDPLGEERLHVVDHVVVGRGLLHRARRPLHVHQHHVAAALRADRRQLRVRAQRGHVVDDLGAGVERRLGDRGLRGVDRDRRVQRRRAPRAPGATRASSSSADDLAGAGTGRLPADVEEVGARRPASSRAWAIAASASRYRPPSENESGVTLTMPISRIGASRRAPG